MNKIYNLIILMLLLASTAMAQISVLRFNQTNGKPLHLKQDEIDSVIVNPEGEGKVTIYSTKYEPNPVEINNFTYFEAEECYGESGLHIGIIGFNNELNVMPIKGPLFYDDELSLHNNIDNLTSDNSTLLYHAVNTALDNITLQCVPYDLSKISLITITSSLDNGSWFQYYRSGSLYANEDELLDGVQKRIQALDINGIKLNSYAIGLNSDEITDDATFYHNLEQLSSSSDKITEATSMTEVTNALTSIANTIISKETTSDDTRNISLKVTGRSPGVTIRFTFDDVIDPTNSNLYIEGVFVYQGEDILLNNIVYSGLSSTTGSTTIGVEYENNVIFSFENILTNDGKMLDVSDVKLWSHTSSNLVWQITSNFQYEFDNDEQSVTNSHVVLLVLDCNSSVGGEFEYMQEATKNFTSILLQDAGDTYIPEGLTDIDNNYYNAVQIGDQIWMSENLKVTRYPNGDSIPYITDDTQWTDLIDNTNSDAYCYYDNNSNSMYGALYTYAAATGDNWVRDNTDNQGICPDGWHLPRDSEWKELEIYMGMSQTDADKTTWIRGTNQGNMLKLNTAWNDDASNTSSNEYGFSALPGGHRGNSSGTFNSAGTQTHWWTSTRYYSTEYAYSRELSNTYSNIRRYEYTNMSYGNSVRCLKNKIIVKESDLFTPTELTASYSTNNRKVTITWAQVPDVTSYHLYRSSSYDGIYQAIGDHISDTTATDGSVNVNELWYYKVTSISSMGESPRSEYTLVVTGDSTDLGVTDIDNNYYKGVMIGHQIWMIENLKVTRYPNGDSIPHISESDKWSSLSDNDTDDGYCYYNNNSDSEYGLLYSYAAATGDNWSKDNVSLRLTTS